MKTTRKHFEAFKQEFQRFVTLFGLTDWDIRFTHKADDECDSKVEFSGEGSKLAVVNLAKEVGADVLYCAKHEAFELLFGDLTVLMCEKMGKDAEKARHEVIHKLEKLID